MKLVLLSLFTLILSNVATAQVRGPRYNPPGGNNGSSNHSSSSSSRTTTTYRTDSRNGSGTYYGSGNSYDDNYYGNGSYYDSYPYNNGPVIVGPRYNPPSSRRVIRTVRRPQVIWSSGFGYTCNSWGDLSLNGRQVHTFRFSSDCQQAISDIRYYGDFCDMEDLYDQTGYLEAQFTFSSECRSALGWYY